MRSMSSRPLFGLSSDSEKSSKKVCTASQAAQMMEKVALVETQISPYQRGRVRYQGIYWYAIAEKDICILPSTRVLVIGQENLTLLVKPLSVLERTDSEKISTTATGKVRHLRAVDSAAAT